MSLFLTSEKLSKLKNPWLLLDVREVRSQETLPNTERWTGRHRELELIGATSTSRNLPKNPYLERKT